VLKNSNHEASPKLEEKYPKLLSELNDSSSAIPAYVRFQEAEQCFLREDLKELKASHFRKNYHNHLMLPKESLVKVQFQDEHLDANKYFQLKYFLGEKDKMDILKQ
jgi:hypothetical protein